MAGRALWLLLLRLCDVSWQACPGREKPVLGKQRDTTLNVHDEKMEICVWKGADMPHELAFFGLYFSPLLPVVSGACLLAVLTAWVCNWLGVSDVLRGHQLLFVVIICIYSCLLGRFWIAI